MEMRGTSNQVERDVNERGGSLDEESDPRMMAERRRGRDP